MSAQRKEKKDGAQDSPSMAAVVDRNIAAMIEERQAEEQTKRLEDRVADAITAFTGSMTFVYLHLVLFGGWILINLGWLPVMKPFDPSFVILAMAASVEAIFLSTFVLISQNKMQAAADRRAELNLHIDLLAEHEVTRMMALLTAIGQRIGIEESHDPELKELAQDVHPEKVLERMNDVEQETADKEKKKE